MAFGVFPRYLQGPSERCIMHDHFTELLLVFLCSTWVSPPWVLLMPDVEHCHGPSALHLPEAQLDMAGHRHTIYFPCWGCELCLAEHSSAQWSSRLHTDKPVSKMKCSPLGFHGPWDLSLKSWATYTCAYIGTEESNARCWSGNYGF